MKHAIFAPRIFPLAILAATVLLVAAGASIAAPSQRTFVASYGSDANPNCNLALPCRSFTAAIVQTILGGEVVILDTAGYGPMTINKSLTVIGPSGVYGGISVLNPVGDGVLINAPGAVVNLRGLDVNGIGGLNGINIIDAESVHVEKSSIGNFVQTTSACIRLESTSLVRLFVTDSMLRMCRYGVFANGMSAANRHAVQIDNTRFERGFVTIGTNTDAIEIVDNVTLAVRNSTMRRFNNGIVATATQNGINPGVYVIDSQLSEFNNMGIRLANAGTGIFTTFVESTQIMQANSAAIAIDATNAGSTTLRLSGVNVMRTNPAVRTTGAGGGFLIVDIVRSQLSAGRVIDHGYGFIRLDDNTMTFCDESIVNSGSGSVGSRDRNNLILCADAPGPAYIVPGLIPGK